MAWNREGGSTTRPPVFDGTNYAYRKDTIKSVVKLNKSFKCRECEGYGHYHIGCPTYLRRQKKSFDLPYLIKNLKGMKKKNFLMPLSILYLSLILYLTHKISMVK